MIAYVATWLLALFATITNGALWTLAWMFPLGLFQIFYPPGLRNGGWGGLLTCFGVYLLHAFTYFRSRTKRSTAVCYVILVLILVCNVSGCRTMMGAP